MGRGLPSERAFLRSSGVTKKKKGKEERLFLSFHCIGPSSRIARRRVGAGTNFRFFLPKGERRKDDPAESTEDRREGGP